MAWFKRVKSTEVYAGTPPPAGWYPDTSNGGRMRYWDGSAWTERFADSAAQPVAPSAPDVGRDPRPHGRPVAPWSDHLMSQGIVGESFHDEAFKTLAEEYGHRVIPDYGVELTDVRAAVIRDPENPYDSNAVAVWIDGRHLVGHLPRQVAAEYTTKLESLDRGTYLQVLARVWIGKQGDWDERTGREVSRIRGSVTLRLPHSDGIVPYNDLPDDPHTILPWGRAVQITGEEHHMEALRAFNLGTEPRHVAATLHAVQEPRRTGEPASLVEVRVDGERVGLMSKALSDQIRDLVIYVSQAGRTPVARAIIKGSDLRADVVVHVARTSEVPQRWLDTVVAAQEDQR